MNISRNMFLAALVAFSMPVIAEDTPAVDAPKTEQQVEAPKAPEATEAPAKEEAPKAEATEAAKSEEKTEEAKGFFATTAGYVALPFVFVGNGLEKTIDFVAKNGGAKRFAKWLGSASVDKDGKALEVSGITSFFANHTVAVKRTLALAEVAVVVAAVKVAYDAFVAEDNNEDEYDFEAVEFDNE